MAQNLHLLRVGEQGRLRAWACASLTRALAPFPEKHIHTEICTYTHMQNTHTHTLHTHTCTHTYTCMHTREKEKPAAEGPGPDVQAVCFTLERSLIAYLWTREPKCGGSSGSMLQA